MTTEHDDNEIGSRIRVIRKAKGLTQVDLAERAGIEAKSVSRIETGVYEPSVSVMRKLAQALGVSVRAFFNEDEVEEDEPITLREVRCRLHEFIPTANTTILLRWYKETLS